MRRVIVYVDGFNLYHAIDFMRQPHLKWLDLRSLAESLLRPGEALSAVKYFTAHATWRPESVTRHYAYVKALKARGCEVILGQFKGKPRKCNACGTKWMAHEEKETDVQIAAHMVSDGLRGQVDRLILISADTDLSPPIKMLAKHVPDCEVFVATPPGRFSFCRALGPRLELRPGRLAKCLLPAEVQVDATRWVSRPVPYNPPA